MEELLTYIYDEDRESVRYFSLRGANRTLIGKLDDLMDHGIVVLKGHWTGSPGSTVTVLVPVDHIDFIVEG